MTMVNLGEETDAYLKSIGCSRFDIRAVWMTDDADQIFLVDPTQFMDVAYRTAYDDGYGVNKISLNVFIIGMFNDVTDFIMYRWEYDGSEGWSHILIPKNLMFFDEIKTLRSLKDGCDDFMEQFRYSNIKDGLIRWPKKKE